MNETASTLIEERERSMGDQSKKLTENDELASNNFLDDEAHQPPFKKQKFKQRSYQSHQHQK